MFLYSSKYKLGLSVVRIVFQRWWCYISSSLSSNMTYLQRRLLIVPTVSSWLVSLLISASRFSLSSSPFSCHVYFCTALHSPCRLYVANVFADWVTQNAGQSRSICHANCWQINSSGALPPKQEGVFFSTMEVTPEVLAASLPERREGGSASKQQQQKAGGMKAAVYPPESSPGHHRPN